jgi:hypothetical protein
LGLGFVVFDGEHRAADPGRSQALRHPDEKEHHEEAQDVEGNIAAEVDGADDGTLDEPARLAAGDPLPLE